MIWKQCTFISDQHRSEDFCLSTLNMNNRIQKRFFLSLRIAFLNMPLIYSKPRIISKVGLSIVLVYGIGYSMSMVIKPILGNKLK